MGIASKWILSLLGEFFALLELNEITSKQIFSYKKKSIPFFFHHVHSSVCIPPVRDNPGYVVNMFFKGNIVWITTLQVKRFVSSGSSDTSVSAAVEIIVSDVRILSGENLRLRCTIPDKAPWSYLWFKGSVQLPNSGQNLFLREAKFRDSGTYYCQGLRETTIKSLKSPPIKITVDGKCLIIKPLLHSHIITPWKFQTLLQ